MSGGNTKSGMGGGLKGIILVVGLGIAFLVQKFTGIDLMAMLNQDKDGGAKTEAQAPKETPKGESGQDDKFVIPDKPKTVSDTQTPEAKTPKAPEPEPKKTEPKKEKVDDGVAFVKAQFAAKRSKVWVTTQGTVKFTLPDDNYEPRHQQFILSLDKDFTVKVAHNIDDAPYLEGLKAGDFIKIQGRYEWEERGGVIHFTHRADRPTKKKPGGWIDWNGKRYQ